MAHGPALAKDPHERGRVRNWFPKNCPALCPACVPHQVGVPLFDTCLIPYTRASKVCQAFFSVFSMIPFLLKFRGSFLLQKTPLSFYR